MAVFSQNVSHISRLISIQIHIISAGLYSLRIRSRIVDFDPRLYTCIVARGIPQSTFMVIYIGAIRPSI